MSDRGTSRRAFIGSSVAAAAGMAVPRATAGEPPHPEKREGRLPGPDVPWLAEVQQHTAPPGAPEPASLLVGDGQRISSVQEWKEKRRAIRRRWLDFLGPIPQNSAPPQLRVIEEDRPPGAIRQLVEYESEPGIVTRAYLIKPRSVQEPRPGVLVLHPTLPATIRQPAGLRDRERDYPFGLRLAQMGCVTLSPENFLWQDPFERLRSDFHAQHPDSSMNWAAKKDIFAGVVDTMQARNPKTKGMGKMLFDAQRALDVLEAMEEADAERLGAIGHSLGSMETLYLSAFDERVQAAVSNEPGISTRFQNWNDPWYLSQAIEDFGHDQEEVLSLVAPRPFLLMGGGSTDGETSWPYVKAALQVYGLYGEPRRLGFFNHGTGHNVPPVAELRAYQWLLTYL